jgi:hypothetical protein
MSQLGIGSIKRYARQLASIGLIYHLFLFAWQSSFPSPRLSCISLVQPVHSLQGVVRVDGYCGLSALIQKSP